MRKQSPQDLYLALAVKLRSRLLFAEHVFTLPAKASQIVETVSLQGRKAVETIAYMALAATEHGFGYANMPRDAKKQWNAEVVFRQLARKKLDVLPSPQKVGKSPHTDYQLQCLGAEEYDLSYDDMIAIYRCFHKGLHEPNPYVQADDSGFYAELLPVLRENIARLKNLTWQHIASIRGRAFLCVLSTDQGNVAVWPLEKVSDLPDSLK